MMKSEKTLPLGRVVITPAALEALDPGDVQRALYHHHHCDWGDVSDADRQSNDEACRTGLRVLSVYKDFWDIKFWIITEADRSYTTVLLPSDY